MSVVLDAEPVVLEEIGVTRTCDWGKCTKEATWECLLTCGCTGAICDQHKIEQAKIDASPRGGHCNLCGARDVRIVQWMPL